MYRIKTNRKGDAAFIWEAMRRLGADRLNERQFIAALTNVQLIRLADQPWLKSVKRLPPDLSNAMYGKVHKREACLDKLYLLHMGVSAVIKPYTDIMYLLGIDAKQQVATVALTQAQVVRLQNLEWLKSITEIMVRT